MKIVICVWFAEMHFHGLGPITTIVGRSIVEPYFVMIFGISGPAPLSIMGLRIQSEKVFAP